jgi:hypothetical protein
MSSISPVEDIDHSRTKTKSPQTNGICECFHKTALNEFYRVAFRKKVYEFYRVAFRKCRFRLALGGTNSGPRWYGFGLQNPRLPAITCCTHIS